MSGRIAGRLDDGHERSARRAGVRCDDRLADRPRAGRGQPGDLAAEPAELDVAESGRGDRRMARPRLAVRRSPNSRPGPRAVSIRIDDPTIQRVVDRALADLELLSEDGPGPGQRLVAAGLPWFAALFGRDSLLTAYEAIAFRPDLAVDALTVLADRQAGPSIRPSPRAGPDSPRASHRRDGPPRRGALRIMVRQRRCDAVVAGPPGRGRWLAS